jgi:nicotinic acid mononucleotide adenylyltransferase
MKSALFLFLTILATSCSQFDIRRLPSDENSYLSPHAKTIIGIYTGTFDPPTNAHKEIMNLAIEKYHVNQLYIYINVSGTKDFKTSFQEREAMVSGMLGKNSTRVKIMPVLQENKELVIASVDKDPGIQTIQFSGQDSFDTMPPDIVRARNRRWVVIPRGDTPVNIPKNSNVDVLTPIDDTSSSEIRKLIAANRLDEANIDPFVADYINKNKLYLPLEGYPAVFKEKLYKKVFVEYIKELKASRPELDLKLVVLPEYLPEQTMGSWATKFTNLIMTKEKMIGQSAEDYRIFSLKTLDQILSTTLQSGTISSPCDPIELIQMFQL